MGSGFSYSSLFISYLVDVQTRRRREEDDEEGWSLQFTPLNSTLLRHLLVWTSTSGLLQVSLFISSFIIGLKVTHASIEAYCTYRVFMIKWNKVVMSRAD